MQNEHKEGSLLTPLQISLAERSHIEDQPVTPLPPSSQIPPVRSQGPSHSQVPPVRTSAPQKPLHVRIPRRILGFSLVGGSVMLGGLLFLFILVQFFHV